MSGFEAFVIISAGAGALTLLVAGSLALRRNSGKRQKALLMIAAALVTLINLALWINWPAI